MKPTIRDDKKKTFHRDATISFWNPVSQQWERRPSTEISTDLIEAWLSEWDA